jgi:glycosyltransferase involved in cell wall biosynthesis
MWHAWLKPIILAVNKKDSYSASSPNIHSSPKEGECDFAMKPDSAGLPRVTFLIPCLNEELTLPYVIHEIKENFRGIDFSYEILVADNGSTDNSIQIASDLGARVTKVLSPGYGAALIGGIKESKGEFVVMGDADGSYHFEDSKVMISKLENGYDFIIGNRFKGGIENGAMPFLHKYLGNPVLSYLAKVFYKIPIHDFHCGLRAFKKEKIQNLDLKSTGMEFASEMIVKASMAKLVIAEVPCRLSKDKRDRKPHLRTWRDGWRHLKFLFAHSPRWAFQVPAFVSLGISLLPILFLVIGSSGISFFGQTLSYKTSIFSMALSLLSVNLFWAFVAAKEIEKKDSPLENYSLTGVALFSFTIMAVGLLMFVIQFIDWVSSGLGNQPLGSNLFMGILSSFLIAIGANSLSFSLVIGFIRANRK